MRYAATILTLLLAAPVAVQAETTDAKTTEALQGDLMAVTRALQLDLSDIKAREGADLSGYSSGRPCADALPHDVAKLDASAAGQSTPGLERYVDGLKDADREMHRCLGRTNAVPTFHHR